MNGGEKTEADLVREMDHGLFVRHVWYVRYVNPRDLTVTGTSRDGLFLVENGEIKHAVKHLRVNDSPLRMLAQPLGIGRPERRSGARLAPEHEVNRFPSDYFESIDSTPSQPSGRPRSRSASQRAA